MAKKSKNHEKTMDDVTAGYEKFIKGKKVLKNKQGKFNEIIKKAATKKRSGSK